jgi:hypothetical protein
MYKSVLGKINKLQKKIILEKKNKQLTNISMMIDAILKN